MSNSVDLRGRAPAPGAGCRGSGAGAGSVAAGVGLAAAGVGLAAAGFAAWGTDSAGACAAGSTVGAAAGAAGAELDELAPGTGVLPAATAWPLSGFPDMSDPPGEPGCRAADGGIEEARAAGPPAVAGGRWEELAEETDGAAAWAGSDAAPRPGASPGVAGACATGGRADARFAGLAEAPGPGPALTIPPADGFGAADGFGSPVGRSAGPLDGATGPGAAPVGDGPAEGGAFCPAGPAALDGLGPAGDFCSPAGRAVPAAGCPVTAALAVADDVAADGCGPSDGLPGRTGAGPPTRGRAGAPGGCGPAEAAPEGRPGGVSAAEACFCSTPAAGDPGAPSVVAAPAAFAARGDMSEEAGVCERPGPTIGLPAPGAASPAARAPTGLVAGTGDFGRSAPAVGAAVAAAPGPLATGTRGATASACAGRRGASRSPELVDPTDAWLSFAPGAGSPPGLRPAAPGTANPTPSGARAGFGPLQRAAGLAGAGPGPPVGNPSVGGAGAAPLVEAGAPDARSWGATGEANEGAGGAGLPGAGPIPGAEGLAGETDGEGAPIAGAPLTAGTGPLMRRPAVSAPGASLAAAPGPPAVRAGATSGAGSGARTAAGLAAGTGPLGRPPAGATGLPGPPGPDTGDDWPREPGWLAPGTGGNDPPRTPGGPAGGAEAGRWPAAGGGAPPATDLPSPARAAAGGAAASARPAGGGAARPRGGVSTRAGLAIGAGSRLSGAPWPRLPVPEDI